MLVLGDLLGQHRVDEPSILDISGRGIDLNYYDVEWFVSETKQSHSVVFAQNAPKYSIWDSFIDYDGYSTSSKRFLLTVVYIMVT